jgi:hypothetical protein
MTPELAELSRKTGLKVRPLDSAAVEKLFDELAGYDSNERAETFNYLKRALNETRASLGAEAAYKEEYYNEKSDSDLS